MIFEKLKRTWTHNDAHLPSFRKEFPELRNVNNEELANRFIQLGMDFYTKKRTRINPLIRLTLPFAIIVVVLMFVFLPINFIITGYWGYSINRTEKIYNWFSKLGF